MHLLCGSGSRGGSLGSRGGSLSSSDGRLGGRGSLGSGRGGGGGSSRGSISLLLPLGGTSPLLLAPRTHVAHVAATGALAGTAKLLGEVLSGHLPEELLAVTAAEDVDLGNGDGVEPSLDDVPDGAEAPGRVDEVELAEALGVVVLREGGGLLDVAEDLGGLGEADALQVHDGAARLEEDAGLAGAGGQAGVGETLVLDSKVGKHALGCCDLVHGIQIDLAKLLDVDRAAILVGNVMSASCIFFFCSPLSQPTNAKSGENW